MNYLGKVFKELKETPSPLEQLAKQFKKLPSEELDKSIVKDNKDIYARDNKEGMDESTQKDIIDRTGWPKEVVEQMNSEAEAKIYENANLESKNINGKDCLIKKDIDLEAKDIYGRSNLDRMKNGLAPLDMNGNPIELHHIGKKRDSSLVELTKEEHRGSKNYKILHDTTKSGEIDRKSFEKERQEHWKERAKEIENNK